MPLCCRGNARVKEADLIKNYDESSFEEHPCSGGSGAGRSVTGRWWWGGSFQKQPLLLEQPFRFRRRGCVTSVPLLWGGGHHCSRQWGPVSELGERLGCCEGSSLVLVPVKALACSLQFSLRCGLLPLSPNSPFVPHPSVLLPPLLTLCHLWTFSYACPQPSFDPHRSFSSPAPDGVSVPSFSWHTVAAHLELQSSLRKKPFPPSEKKKI